MRILFIIASVFLVGVGIVIYLVYNSSPAQQKVLEEKSFTEDIEAMEIMVDNSRVETMPSDGASSRIMLLGNGDGFSLNTKAAGGRLAIEVEAPPRSSISTLTAPIRCKFMCLRAGSDSPFRRKSSSSIKAPSACTSQTAATCSGLRYLLKNHLEQATPYKHRHRWEIRWRCFFMAIHLEMNGKRRFSLLRHEEGKKWVEGTRQEMRAPGYRLKKEAFQ